MPKLLRRYNPTDKIEIRSYVHSKGVIYAGVHANTPTVVRLAWRDDVVRERRRTAAAASKLTMELKPVVEPIIGKALWSLPAVRRAIRDELYDVPHDGMIQDILTTVLARLSIECPSAAASAQAKAFARILRDEMVARERRAAEQRRQA